VPNAQLNEQGVDRADLNSRPPAPIAQFRGADVVIAIRYDQRQRAESFNDVLAGARAVEALQELLQHKASRHDRIAAQERIAKRRHLGRTRVRVTTERE